MKKSLVLLAVLTFLAGAVSCKKDTESSSDTVVIPVGDTANGSEKTEIKLFAMTNFHRNDNDPMKNFVNNSNKYTLTETEFYGSDTDVTQSLTDMNVEILSGNIPDIIVTQGNCMDKLIKKDYMTDLTPLMENYDGVKPDDLLPNVLDSIKKDGEINFIYNEFSFAAVVAKTKNLGDKDMTNWSYKDAIETYKNMPEGMQFIDGIYENNDYYSYMLTKVGYDSIDFENNTCDFDGPFRETLEFLSDNIESGDFNGWDGYEMLNDKALLMRSMSGCGLNAITADLFYELEGSDLTFVGYPSINGQGAITSTDPVFGIMEQSPHKAEAWEIINSLFTEEIQCDPNYTTTTPVLKDAVPEFVSEKNKWAAWSIHKQNPSHLDQDKSFKMTPEQIQQCVDYVQSIKIDPLFDPQINRIMEEEYMKVYNKEQTVDQCINLLNDRISLYLSEND